MDKIKTWRKTEANISLKTVVKSHRPKGTKPEWNSGPLRIKKKIFVRKLELRHQKRKKKNVL